MKLASAIIIAIVAVVASGGVARAQAPDAGKTWASCTERVPQGATRPEMEQSFPTKGKAGWAAALELTIKHGKGETVLPDGVRPGGGEATRALAEAEFVIPDPDGGAGPTIVRTESADQATTKLSISFVPLPKLPGRRTMTLPPVPIAISRANGETITLCTDPHTIEVDPPIANDVDPKVRPNPPPIAQREEWTALKESLLGILVGAVIGAALMLFVRSRKNRPKAAPVVPARLPWLVALEELEAIKNGPLLVEGKFDVYFDKVSDCVRKYLGARYGFDGLETTSDEMRALLRRVRPAVPELGRIAEFLRESDLVKFARVTPAQADCTGLLERGELIVKSTIPVAPPSEPPPPQPTTEAAT